MHKKTQRWGFWGCVCVCVFGKDIWQKNSRGCLQIPAAWRREGKCFCACVPSLKFPGGSEAEITQYKQEKEWAENKGKRLEREEGAMKNAKRRKGVKVLLGKMEEFGRFFLFQAVWHMPIHTERRSHDVTLSEVSRYLPTPNFRITPSCSKISVCCVLPPSVNETLTITGLSSFSVSLQSAQKQPQSDLLKLFFLFRGWIFSPPCPIPFVPQMVKKSSPFVPGLLWHCSTSGFVWREGQEVENPPLSPLPPLPLTDHWALFTAGPLWVLLPNQNGFHWGRRSYVAFYGPERGGGWWSGGGLIWGFLWPLCQGMCVHSHHLLATNTETKACRHTLSLAMCPILAHHKWHHKALDCIVLSFPLFQREHVLCALY